MRREVLIALAILAVLIVLSLVGVFLFGIGVGGGTKAESPFSSHDGARP
jgi:hypothetical protein